MTTRRSFLKALGVGAAVATVPALAKPKPKEYIRDWSVPPDHSWLVKPTYSRDVYASASHSPTDTTIDVVAGHGSRLQTDMVLVNRRSQELLLVTAVHGDEVSVVRGVGNPPCPLVVGDILRIIQSGFAGV